MLSFAQQERKEKGAHTWWWWVLVAAEGPGERPGEGTDEDLGTWRRAAVAQLPHERARAGTRVSRKSAAGLFAEGKEVQSQTPNKSRYLRTKKILFSIIYYY